MSEVKRDIRNALLFECAWEVANKVGGIYTVIKTKVPVTVQEYGDRYTLIGPLSYKTAPMEVEAQEPKDPHLAATLDNMRQAGVKILYGRWLIEGAPNVLLFDTGSQYSRLDEWKGDLWNLAGIPTPPNDHETNETIVFGYIVAWFLGEVRHSPPYPSNLSAVVIYARPLEPSVADTAALGSRACSPKPLLGASLTPPTYLRPSLTSLTATTTCRTVSHAPMFHHHIHRRRSIAAPLSLTVLTGRQREAHVNRSHLLAP